MDSGKSPEIPEKMQAISIDAPGDASQLHLVDLPVPRPSAGEVLVKVAAAGVNRPDIVQRLGLYPPPPGAPDTLGLEVAGIIVEVGADVSELKVGQAVCALVPGGGYATYCIVSAPLALPIPDELSMVQAAALPETFFTVWTNVFDRAGLKRGETFLVHGGSSGIGTSAIQMAATSGARVFATAGSADKCAACEDLGAERAINYRQEDFVEVISELTSGQGVNVILDMVGGDYIARNISALATEGRLVNIAYLSGPKAEVNFMPVMLKRLTLTGSTLRPQTVESKAAIAKALRANIWPKLDQGDIVPIIDSVFPLADASKAHERMESGAHIGKIVLDMS
jgi:putative PIG3 family NAD(P)H quinone oxidoreductase